MPSNGNHEAHDYAERIRERLPRRLQETREAARLSMYALWQKCGVSRDTISRIEGTPEKPCGFWLINEKNGKQPMWHTHRRYFEWAAQHIADCKQRTGQFPTDPEFRTAALEYLKR